MSEEGNATPNEVQPLVLDEDSLKKIIEGVTAKLQEAHGSKKKEENHPHPLQQVSLSFYWPPYPLHSA